MKIDVITAFPEIVDAPLSQSIIGKARERGVVKIGYLNPRIFAEDKHKTIDDRPYGGGPGMILKAEPVYKAIKKLKKKGSYVILTSPRGAKFDQKMAKEFAAKKHLIIVCGHYEGIDARVYPYVDSEVSLGDFILTGGEPAAIVMIDAVARLAEGVFKKDGVTESESFENNLLEAEQYTRPEEWRGEKVPAVLLSGDHKKIEVWKQKRALEITKKYRPDLLTAAVECEQQATSLAAKRERRKK